MNARRSVALAGALLMALVAARLAFGGVQTGTVRSGMQGGGLFEEPTEQDRTMAAQQARARNEARQKEMVADTEKLLALARELDAEIRAGGDERLNTEQAARLMQIEKLAHRVRERMSESTADVPWVRPLPPASER